MGNNTNEWGFYFVRSEKRPFMKEREVHSEDIQAGKLYIIKGTKWQKKLKPYSH